MLLSDTGKVCSEKGSSAIYASMTKNESSTSTHTFVESGFMKHAPHLEGCHEDMGTPDVHTDAG